MNASAGQEPPLDLCDEFTSPELSLHWQFWREFDRSRFRTGDGRLVLAARGSSLADSSPLTCITGDHSYTIEVDIECEPGCEAGLLLFYKQEHSCGIRIGAQGIGVRLASGDSPETGVKTSRATLRIVNQRQEVDFYFRLPGEDWKRTQESAEVASINHNVLGGFLSLRPALNAFGSGYAVFSFVPSCQGLARLRRPLRGWRLSSDERVGRVALLQRQEDLKSKMQLGAGGVIYGARDPELPEFEEGKH